MWQVLLAAAVAGSGFYAKRLLNINAEPIHVSEQTEQKCEQSEEQQHSDNDSSQHQVPISPCDDHNCDSSVFRFSSSGSRGGTGSRFGSKNARKQLGSSRGIRGNVEGFREIEVGKVEKQCGFVEGEGLVMDQRKSGKRFAVCLKKRRTNKNATGMCESCFSKDNSFYGWGLGVGMMCMMSAGKTEISRLNTAMDETVKVVQELKTELSKRKSSHNLHASNFEAGGKHTQKVLSKSSTENRGDVEVSAFPLTEEGECASSVITEEPLPEVLEIDQLEAELESELQKLPWCTKEASALEGRRSDISEIELSVEGKNESEGQTSSSYQINGVLPSELDQKLCHVLIEQQESQIVELESELHRANSKLHEKEAELQALKDCVKRLTEFSLATASDEESEAQVEGENSEEYYEKKMGPESKKSVVGLKRAMDFE
ncbi:hypothetical protein F0562_016438 [Nyssa sinensis]|uniref:Uncharacterized protein n=1 Tax=Nyssa sinensis TaxID=561372 RepID=A0A5J4ZMB1_9ASTE|nr:hypothetical protein F0562_016438 [Nyssa sinensis]